MKERRENLSRAINPLIRNYLEMYGFGGGLTIDFVGIRSSFHYLSSTPFTMIANQSLRLESRLAVGEHAEIKWEIIRHVEGSDPVVVGTYRTRDVTLSLSQAGVHSVVLSVRKPDNTLIGEKAVDGWITVEPGAPPPPPPPPPDPVYFGYRTEAQGEAIDIDIIEGTTDPSQHSQLSVANGSPVVEVTWKTEFSSMDEFGLYHMWVAVPISVQSSNYLHRQNMDFTMSKGAFDDIGSRFSVSGYNVYRLDLTSPVNLRIGINPF